MDGGGVFASTLDWWVEAGVDTIVEDEPRDWLAPPKPVVQDIAAPAEAQATMIAAVAPAVTDLPATLPELHAWLLDPARLAALGPARLAPLGDPAAGLMVLADMPEQGDADSGGLLSGPAGRLLDRMLAAIGIARDAAYVASMSPARIPGGRTDSATVAELTDLARLHVALSGARAVLLLGDRPVQALLGIPSLAAARGRLHQINHQGRTVAAIATFHPRFLLQHAPCKADAWTDLRMLDQEFRR